MNPVHGDKTVTGEDDNEDKKKLSISENFCKDSPTVTRDEKKSDHNDKSGNFVEVIGYIKKTY